MPSGRPSHHSAGQRVRQTANRGFGDVASASSGAQQPHLRSEAHQERQRSLIRCVLDTTLLELSCWHKGGELVGHCGVVWPTKPCLAPPRAGPVSEDPDLGCLPTQLGLASYSILPTQIAEQDQRNNTMAPEKQPRPLSAATIFSDFTDASDYTDRSDQPIEVDVCQLAPPCSPRLELN